MHCPFLILLCGQACFSLVFDAVTSDFLRRYWIIFGLGIWFVIQGIYGFLGGNKLFEIGQLLKSIYCYGVFELFIATAQFVGLCNSMNSFYRITGSFDNPAIFAMLLSFCIPIGLYFMDENTKNHKLWIFFTFCICVGLFIAGSRTAIIASLFSYVIIRSVKHKNFILHLKRLNILLLVCVVSFLLFLYFYKQDSADGRFLIWHVCVGMIKKHPWLGWGHYGFDANYMHFQAQYLQQYLQTDRILLLADNITNPFNEFLLVSINYGCIGVLILFFVIFFLVRTIIGKKCKYKYICLSIITSLLLWSFFSYPSKISFVWILYSFIFYYSMQEWIKKKWQWCIELILFLFLLIYTTVDFERKCKWYYIQKQIQSEKKEYVLTQYKCLYNRLKDNSSFLYNYGAVLHHFKYNEESLLILNKCAQMYNDYNVQMLIADNYKQLGETQKAIAVFKYANAMVPNRFLPLYHEMTIYIEADDSINAFITAKEIIDKPIKIKNSSIVNEIIKEAHLYIQQEKQAVVIQ